MVLGLVLNLIPIYFACVYFFLRDSRHAWLKRYLRLFGYIYIAFLVYLLYTFHKEVMQVVTTLHS